MNKNTLIEGYTVEQLLAIHFNQDTNYGLSPASRAHAARVAGRLLRKHPEIVQTVYGPGPANVQSRQHVPQEHKVAAPRRAAKGQAAMSRRSMLSGKMPSHPQAPNAPVPIENTLSFDLPDFLANLPKWMLQRVTRNKFLKVSTAVGLGALGGAELISLATQHSNPIDAVMSLNQSFQQTGNTVHQSSGPNPENYPQGKRIFLPRMANPKQYTLQYAVPWYKINKHAGFNQNELNAGWLDGDCFLIALQYAYGALLPGSDMQLRPRLGTIGEKLNTTYTYKRNQDQGGGTTKGVLWSGRYEDWVNSDSFRVALAQFNLVAHIKDYPNFPTGWSHKRPTDDDLTDALKHCADTGWPAIFSSWGHYTAVAGSCDAGGNPVADGTGSHVLAADSSLNNYNGVVPREIYTTDFTSPATGYEYNGWWTGRAIYAQPNPDYVRV